jgi:hypothetical protein
MRINTTAEANGIFVTGSSRVVIENGGTYNIQFSTQIDKTDGGSDQVEIWLSRNGINVPDSSTTLEVVGNNAELVAAWNFVLTFNSGDYFELYWHSNDVNMRLLNRGTQSNPTRPAIPSLILTVQQVMYTQVAPTLERRNDFTGTFSYCGSAPLGTAESTAIWNITRIDYTTTTPVSAYSVGAWTNRYSLTYV